MKTFRINVMMMLASAFLVTSCGKKTVQADVVASEPNSKPEVGAIQAAIEYGTGVTQVKAGQEAAKKLKAIDASRKEQMEDTAEQMEEAAE